MRDDVYDLQDQSIETGDEELSELAGFECCGCEFNFSLDALDGGKIAAAIAAMETL